MTVKLKLEGHESSATTEICTDCAYYKHIRTVENEDLHYCTSISRVGGRSAGVFSIEPAAAHQMPHLAAECDFFRKNSKKEFTEKNAPNNDKAYHLVSIVNPLNEDEIIYIGLTPGEYREYTESGFMGMGGVIPRKALERRGLSKKFIAAMDKASPFRKNKEGFDG